MKHGSLFSGIGGFELAAQWMGWDNVFSVEFDPFCQTILKHHFPNSIKHGNIYDFDASAFKGQIDIITGGFPCQPFSVAGKRQGTEDNRYLWPEMLRVIREIGPTWVVAENVRGFINWSDGLVFDTVCADLESEGFEVFPTVLPACGVNAPHRRERVWIVAHTDDQRPLQPRPYECCTESAGVEATQRRTDRQRATDGHTHHAQSAPDTDSNKRRKRRSHKNKPKETERYFSVCNAQSRDWKDFPTESPLCRGDDGLSKKLDGITFPKWRRESIKAYGNAIVPQVAFQLFKSIQKSMA